MKSFKQYLKEKLGSGPRIGISPSSGMGNFRNDPTPPPPSTDDEDNMCPDCGPDGQPGEWHPDGSGGGYFFDPKPQDTWYQYPDGSWECLTCDQDAIMPDPPSTDDPSDEDEEPDEDEDEDGGQVEPNPAPQLIPDWQWDDNVENGVPMPPSMLPNRLKKKLKDWVNKPWNKDRHWPTQFRPDEMWPGEG